jgi:pyruvate dehydrogenase E2 component (dihydrolipoamide acetyltransferase)
MEARSGEAHVTTEIKVPDIGDFKEVPVIEILVKEGDAVNTDDPMISLESDKATMEVPAPTAGIVEKLLLKVGDKVSEGTPILLLKGGDGGMKQPPSLVHQQEPPPSPTASAPAAPAPAGEVNGSGAPTDNGIHASPSVRRIARELDVDLTKIMGTGEKGRITTDDVKAALAGEGSAGAAPAVSSGMGIPEIPAVDFSKFGAVETKPLGRIKKISGPHLHRSWLNVPHVTHTDEADITEIEAFRKELDDAGKADKKPYRVSLLPFLMKASVVALRAHPTFNASLTPQKDALVYKNYYHVGIAVDTPDGLVVPVVRDVDRKGIVEISRELGDLSAKARDSKLSSSEMQGASFTISSLGGIGGTNFTPIVNAPEVAILGVVRSKMAPVWNGAEFRPRLMLPLCLSYDHRVIDGAAAARFTRQLATSIEDVRRLVP